MKNKYHFLIKDARGGFRVQQIAGNGEILNTSQVLDTVDAVYKNILAARLVSDLWADKPSKFKSQKARGTYLKYARIQHECYVFYQGKRKNVFTELSL